MPATDQQQRPLRDLRISVTDRCNFRCHYCMPAEVFDANYPFLPREDILSFEEIVRVAKISVKLGVKKIRLTGGEPLMRRHLTKLISMLKSIDGVEDLALTTNAALLGTKKTLDLKNAGLDRITISLDALSPETFAEMNGVGASPEKVLAGFHSAVAANLPVKLNSVIKKNSNKKEILPLVRFARKNNTTIRFIEYMDVGETNQWRLNEVVSSQNILDIINSEFPLHPIAPKYIGETARRFAFDDEQGEVGFISSVTQPFCANCTRARLSADGQIFTCLFAKKGHQIKSILRSTTDDEILEKTLTSIWKGRTDQYSVERSKQKNMDTQIPSTKPEMSFIGG